MERKARLLMLATVPLYLGPLLAGLSGMGWTAVPVFVALMALWLVVMRPQHWPRHLSHWSPAVAVGAAAQVAINAVIVVILFGIGRGIGGVAGVVLPLPPLVPVGLSFLSIALSRLVWDPVKAQQMEEVLDQALDQINGFNQGLPLAQGGGEPDPMLTGLLDLPEDADPVLVADAIEAAMRAPGAAMRLSQLEDALDMVPDRWRGVRAGVILWATDLARDGEDEVHASQLTAFLAAGQDAELLDLFARRAVPLLRAKPEMWYSFPDRETVGLALDPSLPAPVQDSLRALSEALEQFAPAEEQMSRA